MSDFRPRETHPVALSLIVIVAIFVLYLLSVPPLIRMTMVVGVSGGNPTIDIPPWVHVYAQPWGWIGKNTPLQDTMVRYHEWVFRRP
jgi:hypothetical protein